MSFARVEVRVKDGQGLRGATRAFTVIPGAATINQVQTAMAAWLALVNNVTAGVITGANFHLELDVSGLSANTPGSTDILQNCGVLKFPNFADSHPWDFVVPVIKGSLVSGNHLVLTEGGTVDLLADVMEAAYTVAGAGDSTWTDEDGNNLTPVAGGFRAVRKFGRQLRGSKAAGV